MTTTNMRNPDAMGIRAMRHHLREDHGIRSLPSRASNEAWAGEDLDVVHQDAHRDCVFWAALHTHDEDPHATNRNAYREPNA